MLRSRLPEARTVDDHAIVPTREACDCSSRTCSHRTVSHSSTLPLFVPIAK